jgi:DnaJ-class molecular chaperone
MNYWPEDLEPSDICTRCKGNQAVDDWQRIPLRDNGTGYCAAMNFYRTCPRCNGSGLEPKKVCTR